MEHMLENAENYVWTQIRDLDELEKLRMSAMRIFLSDFERGKTEGRYICHELPEKLPFEDKFFDIGLSSHFLLMYTDLGLDFHICAMTEMLRVCREIRLFPIVDLDANGTDLVSDVIDYFKQNHFVEIRETPYEFQKGGNKMLVIKQI